MGLSDIIKNINTKVNTPNPTIIYVDGAEYKLHDKFLISLSPYQIGVIDRTTGSCLGIASMGYPFYECLTVAKQDLLRFIEGNEHIDELLLSEDKTNIIIGCQLLYAKYVEKSQENQENAENLLD